VTLARSDGPIFAGDVPVGGTELDPASLSSAIHRALDLCASEAPAPLGGLVLSGGAATAPGLAMALGRRLGCPVALADPFRSVALGPRVDVDVLARIAPTFAIAMGLALRGPRTT
jgi:type IV pilus assembly protein PilM